MTTGRKSSRATGWVLGLAAFAVAAMGLGAFLAWSHGGSAEAPDGLASCLGFKKEDGWVVLSRPNSIWSAGTAVEFSERGSQPQPLGDFLKTCLPDLKVEEVVGDSAAANCQKTFNVHFSLKSELGLSKQDLLNADIAVGDGAEPEVSGRVHIASARERRLDLLQIENYLSKERFEAMGAGCRSTLTDPSRFLIAGAYQVVSGRVELSQADGAAVNLQLPKYKTIREAAIKSGFKVSTNGSLEVAAGSAPLTFAVRSADFGRVLKSLGIERRGAADFEQRMKESQQTLSN